MISYTTFKQVESYINNPQLSICELGDQKTCSNWPSDICQSDMYFKNVFSHLNITNIDLNGKNGSLALNLSEIIPSEYHNKFDVVTNFGTSEHVSNQYSVWKNIFLLLKPNGIVISEIPYIHNWPNHCKYYVTDTTFESMNADFSIVSKSFTKWERDGLLHLSVLKKIHNGEFKTSESTIISNIHIISDNFIDYQSLG